MPVNVDFWAKLETALVTAVNEAMEKKAGEIKEALSVEYPPASAKGEAPHMRTGALREGVTVVPAKVEGHLISAEIKSERNGSDLVPSVLENDLNRPFMSTAHLEMLDGGAAREIARNLQQKLNG